MAIQLLYNKIALQQFEKGLKIRYAALPTIRSKESALRMQVKKQRSVKNDLENDLNKVLKEGNQFGNLWKEWDSDFLGVNTINTQKASFAGVDFRTLDYIDFHISSFYIPSHPLWVIQGIEFVKKLVDLKVRIQLKDDEIDILNRERKRTTQKLNLYEKVQIPEYEESIRKIKRFLEDQETLEKATQKIMKKKKELANR